MLVIPFFFTRTATAEIYPLSLHDALPISGKSIRVPFEAFVLRNGGRISGKRMAAIRAGTEMLAEAAVRSEEHTSELQSRGHLVCRLLLEKKKSKRREGTETRK